MIDDATSRLFARLVRSDSTAENMAVLEAYVLRFGRPFEVYTDKASHFVTTPKKNHPLRDEPLAFTDRPRAARTGDRSFRTTQDRLVKGLRVGGARTLEEANRYLEREGKVYGDCGVRDPFRGGASRNYELLYDPAGYQSPTDRAGR